MTKKTDAERLDEALAVIERQNAAIDDMSAKLDRTYKENDQFQQTNAALRKERDLANERMKEAERRVAGFDRLLGWIDCATHRLPGGRVMETTHRFDWRLDEEFSGEADD